MHRRHLTKSQLAFVALEVEKVYAGLAKEKMSEVGKANAGNLINQHARIPEILPESEKINAATKEHSRQKESRDQAAKTVGVSGKMVSMAKAVDKAYR